MTKDNDDALTQLYHKIELSEHACQILKKSPIRYVIKYVLYLMAGDEKKSISFIDMKGNQFTFAGNVSFSTSDKPVTYKDIVKDKTVLLRYSEQKEKLDINNVDIVFKPLDDVMVPKKSIAELIDNENFLIDDDPESKNEQFNIGSDKSFQYLINDSISIHNYMLSSRLDQIPEHVYKDLAFKLYMILSHYQMIVSTKKNEQETTYFITTMNSEWYDLVLSTSYKETISALLALESDIEKGYALWENTKTTIAQKQSVDSIVSYILHNYWDDLFADTSFLSTNNELVQLPNEKHIKSIKIKSSIGASDIAKQHATNTFVLY